MESIPRYTDNTLTPAQKAKAKLSTSYSSVHLKCISSFLHVERRSCVPQIPFPGSLAATDPPPRQDQLRDGAGGGAVGERLADAAGTDVAVVDPPRKGLDPLLLDALCDPPDGFAISLTKGGQWTSLDYERAGPPREAVLRAIFWTCWCCRPARRTSCGRCIAAHP
eukprot:scaffold271_cov112-Isochrysis_galbana.AAC.3